MKYSTSVGRAPVPSFTRTQWLNAEIDAICRDTLSLHVTTEWQLEPDNLNVMITVVAENGKRVSKIFTKAELDSPLDDGASLSEMRDRVSQLLVFLLPEKKKRRNLNKH